MPAPTLKSMAQRNLIRNITNLQDVGDTPYEAVKPALRKIVDPQQLHTIETASPHIADADSELWIAYIKRDIPNWKDKMVKPKNPRSWWKVYRKLWREEEAAQEELQRDLKEKLMAKKQEQAPHQTNFLSTVIERRERQAVMLDGNPNPKAGSYGFERVGSVANAHKGGKNIISAIRKAATKPAHFNKGVVDIAAERKQAKMWQTPPPQPGKRKSPPSAVFGGPVPTAQRLDKIALDRAMAKEDRINKEKAERTSKSPTPPWAVDDAELPPEPKPVEAASAKPVPARVQSKPATAASPARTASPAVPAKPSTPLGPGAGVKRTMSPSNANPVPPQKRQRPTSSIFMPKRMRR